MRHLATLSLATLMLASCKDCNEAKGSPDAAARLAPEAGPAHQDAAPMVDAAVADTAVSETRAPDATAAMATDAMAADEPFGDAGTSACRLVYGPAT